MKRLIVLLALIGTLCSCGSSQKSEPANMINGHEYVDLGLPSGLKWATCNVGASSPEDYGGEYNLPSKVGVSENLDYDPVSANWGESWRMPTYEEMIELELYCKCETIKKEDGIYLKITGPNGNHIIVPTPAAYIAQGGFVILLPFWGEESTTIECEKYYNPEQEGDIAGCIRPVSGEKITLPEVRRKIRFDEFRHPLHVSAGGDWSINGNVELDNNNPNLFIHIGPPIKSYQAQYGNAPRIEINGKFVTCDEIDELIVTKLYEDADTARDSINILIHAQPRTSMGIIRDVEESLKGRWTANVLYDIDDDLYMCDPPQTDERFTKDNELFINKRNFAIVKINSMDRIWFRMSTSQHTIKDEVKRFIQNPYNDPNLPGKKLVSVDYKGKYYEFLSSDGMIWLQTDRGTSYETYLSVYHEIICAFDELRDEESMRVFGQRFSDLNKEQQDIIKSVIPTSCYQITDAYMEEIPPPPPAALEINFSDVIDIKDDDIEVEDIVIETEDDEDFTIEIMDYDTEEIVEEIEDEAIPFAFVEQKPSFQGGDGSQFSKWVNERLVYPEIAKENGVQGRVTLQFTVEKDGSITKVKVLRGVDPSLDKEAVRVVSMSPKWTPGKQRDRAVPVTYTFPVIFQLR